MVDRYTKAVLSVIAISLAVIAGQNVLKPAVAQASGCGETPIIPCWVQSSKPFVVIPATPDGNFPVIGVAGGAPVGVTLKQ